MVTREQILSGLEKFVVNDVISKIQDRALCIVLDTMLGLLERRPEMLDKLIDNPVFKVEGGYDVDTIADVVKGSIKKLGAFPVVFPAVPLISPAEKILSFSADDIDALVAYIKGGK